MILGIARLSTAGKVADLIASKVCTKLCLCTGAVCEISGGRATFSLTLPDRANA